jgi:hypothetical protein
MRKQARDFVEQARKIYRLGFVVVAASLQAALALARESVRC